MADEISPSPRSGDLSDRVDALDARVAALEATRPPQPSPGATTSPQAANPGDTGVVSLGGTVQLPTGERYEWLQAGTDEDLLADDWAKNAGALAALAHPVRLLLLRLVLTGVRTVGELSQHETLGTSGQLYHHLRQLTAAGWLEATSRGHYAVPPVKVVPLLAIIEAVRRQWS